MNATEHIAHAAAMLARDADTAAAERAIREQAQRTACAAVHRAEEAERDRDTWKARAEASETELAAVRRAVSDILTARAAPCLPPLTREEIEKAIRDGKVSFSA